MSWLMTNAEEEKKRFLRDWFKEEFTFTQLCLRYGISRKTGYKLLNRFYQEGETAVVELSRARHNHPNQSDERQVEMLINLKHRYPYWGPKKLKDWLVAERPDEIYPAPSTIGSILKKHGLVKERRRNRKVPAHSSVLKEAESSNEIWCADFKGQFRLQDGKYCYPLTISDHYSRYLLGCQGLLHPRHNETQDYFERCFREYGLPEKIRTDNGQPFAGLGIGGLSRLSVWLLKLGVLPERIRRGKPQDNGRHERMHRTLKAETTQPSCFSLSDQQKRFDEFRKEYNQERSHEGIGRKRPSQIYQASNRSFPERIPEIIYPDRFEIRRVRSNGEIKWCNNYYFISELICGEPIGLEMIDEGRAILYFAQLKLGVIDARLNKIIRPAS